jgi:pSer/pThr/pTyr-binding forkhead associated (FHA) protein
MEHDITMTFMSGPLDGRTLHFQQPPPGDELVLQIGRREGCDIHLPFDNQVSRVHARIGILSRPVTATESMPEPFVLTFWLEDMRSRNGTFIERERQAVNGRVPLRPGTLFRIGRTWIRLDEPLPM